MYNGSMKKNIFLLAVFLFIIAFNNEVFSAIKNKGRTSRSRVATRSVSGKLSGSNFVGSVQNISVVNSVADDVMSCGVPAVATNAQAKRICALVMADAMKTYCKNYSCQSKLKVELSFNFGLSSLSEISADVNGVNCSGENLSKFCTAFQSELVDGLWDLYSEPNVRERKNCNMALAKYSVAQDCFQYILAEKNQSVGGIFNSSKISNLDKEIDKRCGKDAIIAKYKLRAIDDLSDDDEKTFFGGAKMNDDGTLSFDGESYQGKKKLSSTVASLFANVGDNTWNIMGQVGKLADLKLDMKSNTYPRELTVIANTFVTEVENTCGKNIADSMQDTSFELVDNRSALELAVAKKGLLKGAYDMVANDKWKEKGIIGVVKEKIDESKAKKTNKNVYPEFDKDKSYLSSCNDTKDVTGNVREILSKISKAIKAVYAMDEKYRDTLYENNKNNIIENVNLILKFSRRYDDGLSVENMERLSDETLAGVEKIVNDLSNTKIEFKCPGQKFIDKESVSFDFKFDTQSIDAITKALLDSKERFMNDIEKLENENIDNKEEFNRYRDTIEKMGQDKPKK